MHRLISKRSASPTVLLVTGLIGLVAVTPMSATASDTDDKIALTELTHRYAFAIDTLDRSLLSRVFTPDASAHYLEVGPPILGLDVQLEGFDSIYAWLQEGLSHRTAAASLPQHFMSNHIIDVDGDSARMTYYMHNRAMAGGGVYYVDAIRTKAGWRIQKLRLEEQIWKPEVYENQPKPEMKLRPQAAPRKSRRPD